MDNTNFLYNAIKDKDEIRISPHKTEYSSYEEMQKKKNELIQIAKMRIRQMTESFDLSLFYKQPNNFMGVILITPSQVAIVYGAMEILHDCIRPILIELTNNKRNNPIVVIEMRYEKENNLSFCIPFKRGLKGQISKDMNNFLTKFYNKLKKINIKDARTFDESRKKNIKYNELVFSLKEITGKSNYKEDQELIGVPLKKYLKRLEENELEL